MAKTHLVFTDASDGLRIARPKGTLMLAEVEDGVCTVSDISAEVMYVVTKESFDELLVQLLEE